MHFIPHGLTAHWHPVCGGIRIAAQSLMDAARRYLERGYAKVASLSLYSSYFGSKGFASVAQFIAPSCQTKKNRSSKLRANIGFACT